MGFLTPCLGMEIKPVAIDAAAFLVDDRCCETDRFGADGGDLVRPVVTCIQTAGGCSHLRAPGNCTDLLLFFLESCRGFRSGTPWGKNGIFYLFAFLLFSL